MKATELAHLLLDAAVQVGDYEVVCCNPAGDLADVQSVLADDRGKEQLIISCYLD